MPPYNYVGFIQEKKIKVKRCTACPFMFQSSEGMVCKHPEFLVEPHSLGFILGRALVSKVHRKCPLIQGNTKLTITYELD